MRKVSNKKVIQKLSLRMMRANRERNIAVIIAILLTTIMFTTLFSVGISMIETTRKSTMRQVGAQSMAGFKYGRLKDYEKLKSDEKVKKISYRIIVGMLADPRLNDTTTEVYYAEDENAKDGFSYPTAGHMPKAENEVALSTITMDKLGIEKELGQKIPLSIQVGEDVIQKEFILSGYWEGDSVAMAQMAYISKEYQEMLAPEPAQSYYETQRDDMTGYWSIDFDFNSSFNIEKQVKELLQRNGYDVEIHQYGVNWAYETASVDAAGVLLVVLILFFIMMAGYLIIYNIFYISVVSDIHEYGLLKTIGTSGRQLRRIVRMQALSLSIVGIPLGMILGTIISKVVFLMLLKNTNVNVDDVVISIHPLIYILTILFVFLTVMIGSRKPAKTAQNVSAIEAVKYEQVMVSRKKEKRIKKVSVMQLAFQNLKREKRKVLVVMCSLTLSILLVNGLYSVVIGLNADKYVSTNIIGDFNVVSAERKNSYNLMRGNIMYVSQEDMAYLSGIDGISECANVFCEPYSAYHITEDNEEVIEDLLTRTKDTSMKEEVMEHVKQKQFPYDFYGIDDFALDHVTIHEGEIDKEKWKTGKYAIGYSYQLIDRSVEDEKISMFSVGDTVTVTLENGQKCTYEIMAVAEMPYALSTQSYYSLGGQIIISAEEYLTMDTNKNALISVLNAKEDAAESVEEILSAYAMGANTISYTSKQTYLDEFNDFIQSIGIVGGALAFILAVIGIMNFANSIITGIWKRSRELAIMQAVGLTKKQMTQMLMLEGMFYGVFTILMTLGIHVLFGQKLVYLLVGEIWYFEERFTILPIVVCLPFVLVISAIIPLIVCNTMKRKSVVDRMRM